ncbi:MAG: hypothetical protein HAW67_04455 [Endozoicomonadaceae bacterium]|nr:hypothetical protein [Endozoicomonadaceae bacterium]
MLEKSLAAHESKTKETKLPANTPVNVVEWVRKVEQFYSVNALKGITELSTMNDIEQAYNIDRSALIGIGEELLEAAKWDAWPDSSFE